MDRPGGVKVLAGCYLLSAVVYPWAFRFPLFSVLLYLVFSLVMLLGLWELKNWARMAEIVLCAAAVAACTVAYVARFPDLSGWEKLGAGLASLVLDLAHLLIIYYFLRPEVRKHFT